MDAPEYLPIEVNADFSQRVVLDTNALDWVPSPLLGVDRRMLDRIGDEVARATSIVRYAPGSSFSAHTRSGGEEFLVLDGVFSDEHDDCGPGLYVRNPVGFARTQSSAPGCTILVKLWQMYPEDQTFVRTDARNGDWQETDAVGAEKLALQSFGPEEVMMFRLAPGASVPRHGHSGARGFWCWRANWPTSTTAIRRAAGCGARRARNMRPSAIAGA